MNPEQDPNPTRLTIALVIFKHLGPFIVSLLVLLPLIVWQLISPSDRGTEILAAVFGLTLSARVIQSIVHWVNRRDDPLLAKRPPDAP